MIQASRGSTTGLGLSSYSFFNEKLYEEVDGESMTWLQAGKMVNRSERFMRLVRTLAYGAGNALSTPVWGLQSLRMQIGRVEATAFAAVAEHCQSLVRGTAEESQLALGDL